MRVEITKKFISDDDKSFSIGRDIAFTYNEKHYIGEITDISDINLILKRVECKCIEDGALNYIRLDGSLVIPFAEMTDCNYVSCD